MSMQGWRIEVREDIAGYLTWSPDMTDPNGPTLTVYWFLLHPTRVSSKAFERVEVAACAWPLRDTIYISRALTDAEADTLRELLDAEMRRERAKAVIGDLADAMDRGRRPPKSFTISPGFDAIEAGQAVTLAPDGTVRPIASQHVTINVPSARTTAEIGEAMRKALVGREAEYKVTYDPATGYTAAEHISSLPEDERAQHIASGYYTRNTAQPQPRVPQVGDEIEVRGDDIRFRDWTRSTVKYADAEQMVVANASGALFGMLVDDDRWAQWRWPETKS